MARSGVICYNAGMSEEIQRPLRKDLHLAYNKTLPDVIAPGLRVLFCGINPGLYSAFVGHHFAKPGNRFWPTLHAAGFTPHQFKPEEQHDLLSLGYGLTNIVARPTAMAKELTSDELREGRHLLEEKLRAYSPRILAVIGVTAYRQAFAEPTATFGLQPDLIGSTEVWVLPNTSGLNAGYYATLKDYFHEVFQRMMALEQ